jgi:hypothetical protein
MALRLVLLVLAIVTVIGIFGALGPSASMMGIFQNLSAPVLTMAYAGEISQISSLVDDFIELRENRSSDNAEKLSANLDQRINNLEIVKIYCNEEISSLELAFEKNPYKKLQQICPELKNLSMSKAAQLFRQI